MNKLRLIAILLTSTLLLACEPASRQDAVDAESMADAKTGDGVFSFPYEIKDLPNGLRVIAVETGYPDIVTIQIPVMTGSRNEVEPGKSGFAHFFEHMMFRGTEQYPVDEYLGILKNAGADQNAYTTDDYTNYYITFTKPDLEKVIELEADRFQNLKYTEEQFRTEAQAVKGEYLKNYSNPAQKLYETTRNNAYTTHPYKHTTMGFLEDIEAMPDQMEYAQQFFERWYTPEKATVILAGDIDPDEVFQLVEKYWGDWQGSDYQVDIPQEPAPQAPTYDHVQWEAPTQPWMLLAFHGPAFSSDGKAMPAMDLISQVYFSESSDIYQKVVNQEQWADQFGTLFPDSQDPGLLMFFIRLTDGEHADKVREAVLDTLAQVRGEAMDAALLEETKSRLKYNFASQLDSTDSVGGVLAAYARFDRDPETINALYRSYDSLTADDIVEQANTYFTDARMVTTSLSNENSLGNLSDSVSLDERVVASGPQEPANVEMLQRPSSSPLVDVAFLFNTGPSHDPAGKKGLASLTASMVADGGSTRRSIADIDQAMYPMASSFDVQVDKEMIRFAGTVHRDNLDDWYALASDQLLDPGWREDDFERIKTQTRNAIRSNLVGNNDEELGKEALYSFIYGDDHPYGSLNLGAVDDLDDITLDDVKQFYRDQLTLENVTVGLAGGYPETFIETLNTDLQALPRGESFPMALSDPRSIDGYEAIVIEKETPAVAVSFGYPIDVKRGDEDWIALWLVRSYLGEHRSSNSYLYKRIREQRGMNYGDYAYIEYFPNGMFQSQPSANLGRRQQIFQVWLRPLRSNVDAHFATRTAIYEINNLIENGMSQEDFEDTRNFLEKYASLLTASQSRQLGYALDSDYYGTAEFAEYVRDGLSKLTLGDVNRVIRENLQTDNLKFVFISADPIDMKQRLVSNQVSTLEYNTPKGEELLAEDAIIEKLPLPFTDRLTDIVSSETIFN